MRRILIIFLSLLSIIESQAARQEENISQMIVSLHHEYKLKWNEINQNRAIDQSQLHKIDSILNSYNENSKQSLMVLYSTDSKSFQEIASASQNAINLYDRFAYRTTIYTSMLDDYRQNYLYQDSLLKVLNSIDVSTLSQQARKLYPELTMYIECVKSYDNQILCELVAKDSLYIETSKRINQIKELYQHKYEILRNEVLSDFGDNIFDIVSDWAGYLKRMNQKLDEQLSINEDFINRANEIGLLQAIAESLDGNEFSSWGSVRIVIISVMIIELLVLAFLLSILICFLRWAIKKILNLKFWVRTSWNNAVTKLLHRINYVNGTKTLVILTLWLNVILWILFFIIFDDGEDDNGVIASVAVQTLYFFALLAFIITFCVLHYSGKQTLRSLAVCIPSLISFIYSLFGIIVVMPDEEIIIESTILSVILFVIQSFIYWITRRHLDDLMVRISQLSMIFLGGSMIVALLGLQFLSTLIVVFWCCFMVCSILLSLSKKALYTSIKKYDISEQSIKHNWWILILGKVLYPMAWIYAVLISCRIACRIYSLNDFVNHLLNTYFITPLGNISLNVNLMIFICWNILIAAYLSSILYQLVAHYYKSKNVDNWKDSTFFNQSVIRFVVWGVAIINIMVCMGFNLEWVGYCMAGISTGLGFASREILENLIYGLTLRNGQLKIGDWIICEGLRGQIKNIGLLSTKMECDDGSVITFTNSRLFSMSYQNITLNNGYELLHTEFGVNIGEDLDKLRKMIIDEYAENENYDKTRPISLRIKNITNGQVDLDFCVWVPASDISRLASFNKEYVYNILNSNGIKYPYTFIEVSNV